MVRAARPQAGLADRRVQALDGRALRRVRADVKQLGHPAFVNRPETQPLRECRIDLSLARREGRLELVARR